MGSCRVSEEDKPAVSRLQKDTHQTACITGLHGCRVLQRVRSAHFSHAYVYCMCRCICISRAGRVLNITGNSLTTHAELFSPKEVGFGNRHLRNTCRLSKPEVQRD